MQRVSYCVRRQKFHDIRKTTVLVFPTSLRHEEVRILPATSVLARPTDFCVWPLSSYAFFGAKIFWGQSEEIACQSWYSDAARCGSTSPTWLSAMRSQLLGIGCLPVFWQQSSIVRRHVDPAIEPRAELLRTQRTGIFPSIRSPSFPFLEPRERRRQFGEPRMHVPLMLVQFFQRTEPKGR